MPATLQLRGERYLREAPFTEIMNCLNPTTFTEIMNYLNPKRTGIID